MTYDYEDNDDTYVCRLPGGYHLFRKPNEAGGFTYYSDEVGGGVFVWDTGLVADTTLMAAIVAEQARAFETEIFLKRETRDQVNEIIRADSEDEA